MLKSGLTLIITYLTVVQSASTIAPPFSPDIASEEYLVYSAVIKRFGQPYTNKLLFIVDRTIDPFDPEELLDAFDHQQQPYLERATLYDYRRKYHHPCQLTDQFQLSFGYMMLNKESHEEIFKDGCTGWCKYFEDYPNSSGFISFSRVGFNPEGSQALVYVIHGCGGLCGTSGYMVLKKQEGEWMIQKSMAVWIS